MMNEEFEQWQQNQIRSRNEELNEITLRNETMMPSVNERKNIFQDRINIVLQTRPRNSVAFVDEVSYGNSNTNQMETIETHIANTEDPDHINIIDQELGELIRSQRVSSLLNSSEFRRILEEKLQSSLASARPAYSSSNTRAEGLTSEGGSNNTVDIDTLIDPNNDPEIQSLVNYQIVSNMLQSAFRTHLENTLWSRHIRRENHSVAEPLNVPHGIRSTSLSTNENNLLHSMRNELTEMRSMMRILLQSQIETHRSIRQEVTAALRFNYRDTELTQTSDFLSSCVICMNSTADTVVYRCGHQCLCYACSIQMRINVAGGIMSCPICRTPIDDIIRIFSSSHSLTN